MSRITSKKIRLGGSGDYSVHVIGTPTQRPGQKPVYTHIQLWFDRENDVFVDWDLSDKHMQRAPQLESVGTPEDRKYLNTLLALAWDCRVMQ